MADTPGTACEAMVTMNSGTHMLSTACHDHVGTTNTGRAARTPRQTIVMQFVTNEDEK
jgi:hypothetical protein